MHLEFDTADKLTAASCTCPDFEKRTEGMGTPELHGVRVCKHMLATSLEAKGAQPQLALPHPQSNGHTQPISPRPERQDVKPAAIRPSLLSTAAEQVWDADCEEWIRTDSNGTHYCGSRLSECVPIR